MDVGQVFNPYKSFHGAFIPNWLLARQDVSHGAKLIYARLSQYSGKGGICRPRQSVLATETGMCERQLRDYLTELKSLKLIRSAQRGLGLSNEYQFLWHEWIDGSLQVVDSESGKDSPDGTAESCRPERREAAAPTVQEEIQLKDVRTSKFQKPSLEEAKVYGKLKALTGDQVEHWYDYYESNGWKVGPNPMKNWQAAMRNWKKQQRIYQPANNGNGSTARHRLDCNL